MRASTRKVQSVRERTGTHLTDKFYVQVLPRTNSCTSSVLIFKALHIDALLQYQVSRTFFYVFSAQLKNFSVPQIPGDPGTNPLTRYFVIDVLF